MSLKNKSELKVEITPENKCGFCHGASVAPMLPRRSKRLAQNMILSIFFGKSLMRTYKSIKMMTAGASCLIASASTFYPITVAISMTSDLRYAEIMIMIIVNTMNLQKMVLNYSSTAMNHYISIARNVLRSGIDRSAQVSKDMQPCIFS